MPIMETKNNDGHEVVLPADKVANNHGSMVKWTRSDILSDYRLAKIDVSQTKRHSHQEGHIAGCQEARAV